MNIQGHGMPHSPFPNYMAESPKYINKLIPNMNTPTSYNVSPANFFQEQNILI